MCPPCRRPRVPSPRTQRPRELECPLPAADTSQPPAPTSGSPSPQPGTQAATKRSAFCPGGAHKSPGNRTPANQRPPETSGKPLSEAAAQGQGWGWGAQYQQAVRICFLGFCPCLGKTKGESRAFQPPPVWEIGLVLTASQRGLEPPICARGCPSDISFQAEWPSPPWRTLEEPGRHCSSSC